MEKDRYAISVLKDMANRSVVFGALVDSYLTGSNLVKEAYAKALEDLLESIK